MTKELNVKRHSFKKHGSSNHFNGSKDDLVKIEGIYDLKMPLPKKEFELLVNIAKKIMNLKNFLMQ